ncbi:MAG: hypothetical protein US31_C0016G0009 [Berkelbacteria bacterium GW2011_GWA1_36_9]|uniref:Uncharacterized protein n=1 Tax=Berkelbacteria bacterium GW2011_GWA1_36_9 TaxID=1618331 RepID=A0A0G0FJ02_9BACT|nr:MAG: hypothetical protein US31_C0016G0009 [Berkelbacteria bacterium GW2011_GWA1_36_9]
MESKTNNTSKEPVHDIYHPDDGCPGMQKVLNEIERMKQSHRAREKFLKERGGRWEKLSEEDFKKYIEM